MPENVAIKMRYNDIKTLTSTAGAYNVHQFNISSVYDPDYTSVGHQPYGYDQISGLFSAYCVRYAEVILKVQAPTSPMRVWLEPKFNSATVSSNMSLISERVRTYSFGVSDSPVVRKFRVYLPSLAGVTWEWWKRECASVPSASPTTSTYFNIYTQAVDTVTTCTLCYEIEIKYDVLFTQPTAQNQS